MLRYPQTVYHFDSAGLQYFIQCITHSQEEWKTRQIISKVRLPHFSALHWLVVGCKHLCDVPTRSGYCDKPHYATSRS